MTAENLKKILDAHAQWLNETGGARANLTGADLTGANLRGADLTGAFLVWANLTEADLRGARMRGADLRGANLREADLSGANLREADLSGANLTGADLTGADLRGVYVDSTTAGYWPVCPEEGEFCGWKQCRDKTLVKLLIPADSQRSSATTRKCRCDKAVVLDIIGAETAVSLYDPAFVYHKGETVSVADFDTDRWAECSTGIHFYLTRAEAEAN